MTTTENALSTPSIPDWTPGDRVRRARLRAHLSQEQLADITGISRTSISNYEADITPCRGLYLKAVSAALNVPTWWIASGATTPPTVAYVASTLTTRTRRERAGGRPSVTRGSRPGSYPAGRVKPQF